MGETRVEEGEEVNETETFRASNKRKREETPFQEGLLQPLACGAQARRGLEDVLHGGDDVHLTHSSWNPQFCAAIAQRLRSFGKSESCASIEQKLGLPLCTSSQPPPFLLNTFSSTS